MKRTNDPLRARVRRAHAKPHAVTDPDPDPEILADTGADEETEEEVEMEEAETLETAEPSELVETAETDEVAETEEITEEETISDIDAAELLPVTPQLVISMEATKPSALDSFVRRK